MKTMVVRSKEQSEMIEITSQVHSLVAEEGVQDGVVDLFVPHTTAGITINENADPAVERDMLADLERLFPWRQSYYLHGEGNSAAHMKASMVGANLRVFIEGGHLVLGTWQGIYMCEFDGPRQRKVFLYIASIR